LAFIVINIHCAPSTVLRFGDRHWRNIRTITLHNPVAYKARVIGQNLLHGTPVPANAYF